MGASASVNRVDLTALGVWEVADLVYDAGLSEYRQACVDYGVNGEMLTSLPPNQLREAFRRAGVDTVDHLDFLLEELEKVNG